MEATTGVVASTTIETKRAATEATMAKVPSTTARIVRRLFHHAFGGNHAPNEGYVGTVMSSETRIGA